MSSSGTSNITDHIITLPSTPHTVLHARLQPHAHALVVHLTSTTHAETSGSSALGSFIYALPNRLEPTNPLSTPLVSVPNSIEFATRAAKILARRIGKPVYVSSSIDLSWGPGNAGQPEVGEEVEALRKVVEVVTKQAAVVNGVAADGS